VENLLFLGTVLLAGMASFLMPCILPLIPAYISYLTGENVGKDDFNKRSIIINSIAFVSGFIIVFVLLGAAATSLGQQLTDNKDIIRKIAGVFIVFMGSLHTDLIKIKFLGAERRFNILNTAPGVLKSIIIGAGFGLGWSPCMGPVLTSLLLIASQSDTVGAGVLLLFIYGLGVGIPFLTISTCYNVVWRHVKFLGKHARVIKKVSGAILIILGILIYFNKIMFLTF